MAVTTIHIHKNRTGTPSTYQYSQANRIFIAIGISLLLHGMILLGVTFQFPEPKLNKIATSLEIVLVNNKTPIRPTKTEILAQHNLDGGGNMEDNHRAKAPLPILPKSKPPTDKITVQQKIRQLEQETKQLMPTVDKPQQANPSDTHDSETESEDIAIDTTELLLRSLDIARLRAQIDRDYDNYQKRPKRKFVGARTKEYRFSRYVEDWRLKVERIGNLNYPEIAKKNKLHGNLQLTVSIRADGGLESIEINRSSGLKILDEAAIKIVKLAGQNGFSPFPPEISKDTDILHITRTWVFAPSDRLLSQ